MPTVLLLLIGAATLRTVLGLSLRRRWWPVAAWSLGCAVGLYGLHGWSIHWSAAALTRLHTLHRDPVHTDKTLADFELAADRQLQDARLLMRLGPMLGLMGTLIPMGPALTGLASGDIVSMAANMQVAFATTVVGVFVGGAGYLVLLLRKRWCAADINTLQYLIELAAHETD